MFINNLGLIENKDLSKMLFVENIFMNLFSVDHNKTYLQRIKSGFLPPSMKFTN